jgi:hypothetical protein
MKMSCQKWFSEAERSCPKISRGVNVGELHVYRSGNAAFKDGSFDLCFIRWRSLKILGENNCPRLIVALHSTLLARAQGKRQKIRFFASIVQDACVDPFQRP